MLEKAQLLGPGYMYLEKYGNVRTSNTLSFAGVLRNDPGTWQRLTIPTRHFNTAAVAPGAGARPARPSSLMDKALLCVCHSWQKPANYGGSSPPWVDLFPVVSRPFASRSGL